MYRISRTESGKFRIEHFANGDPNPTPTARTEHNRPEAATQAFGSAAKMYLMMADNPGPNGTFTS